MARVRPAALQVRPVEAGDAAFCAALYRSTRDDLLPLAADPQFFESLVAMQQQVQAAGYRHAFPDAAYEVLVADGSAAGRLVTDIVDGAIRVVDIAVLPAWRGQGVAGEALRRLQVRAAGQQRDITLSVRMDNAPARRLYASLGFVLDREDAVSLQLRWRYGAPGAG